MHSQIVVNLRFHGEQNWQGDQFWQPKLVRGDRIWRGTDFFVTAPLMVLEWYTIMCKVFNLR